MPSCHQTNIVKALTQNRENQPLPHSFLIQQLTPTEVALLLLCQLSDDMPLNQKRKYYSQVMSSASV